MRHCALGYYVCERAWTHHPSSRADDLFGPRAGKPNIAVSSRKVASYCRSRVIFGGTCKRVGDSVRFCNMYWSKAGMRHRRFRAF